MYSFIGLAVLVGLYLYNSSKQGDGLQENTDLSQKIPQSLEENPKVKFTFDESGSTGEIIDDPLLGQTQTDAQSNQRVSFTINDERLQL